MNKQDRQALLDQLRGVQAPDVSAWPAVGWWLLVAGLLLTGAIFFLLYRRYLSYRWQREARAELHRVRSSATERPVSATLADCSRLARRVLLTVRGREAVARLQGRLWLEALDSVCQRPLFASGFGQLLESGPYQRNPQVNAHDLDSLFDAIEELIRSAARHRTSPIR